MLEQKNELCSPGMVMMVEWFLAYRLLHAGCCLGICVIWVGIMLRGKTFWQWLQPGRNDRPGDECGRLEMV